MSKIRNKKYNPKLSKLKEFLADINKPFSLKCYQESVKNHQARIDYLQLKQGLESKYDYFLIDTINDAFYANSMLDDEIDIIQLITACNAIAAKLTVQEYVDLSQDEIDLIIKPTRLFLVGIENLKHRVTTIEVARSWCDISLYALTFFKRYAGAGLIAIDDRFPSKNFSASYNHKKKQIDKIDAAYKFVYGETISVTADC